MIFVDNKVDNNSQNLRNILFSEFWRMYKGLPKEKYAIIYAKQNLGKVDITNIKLHKDYEIRLVDNKFYYYIGNYLVNSLFIADYENNFNALKSLLLSNAISGIKMRTKYGKIRTKSTFR